MKLLHIAPKKVWFKHGRRFSEGSHYIDIPGKNVLMISSGSDAVLEELEAEPGVTALPHPLSGEPIGPKAAALLQEACPEISESHTTIQACLVFKKISKKFSLSAF